MTRLLVCVKIYVQDIVSIFQDAVGTPAHNDTGAFIRQLPDGLHLGQENAVIQGRGYRVEPIEDVGKELVAAVALGLLKVAGMDAGALGGLSKEGLVVKGHVQFPGQALTDGPAAGCRTGG